MFASGKSTRSGCVSRTPANTSVASDFVLRFGFLIAAEAASRDGRAFSRRSGSEGRMSTGDSRMISAGALSSRIP